MIQSTRTKARTRTSHSVQLEFLIQVHEIKPWPPTQSLRAVRAVLIQWEHGERSSGSTNQVVPSIGPGSGIGDGKIEFNESFRLPVTLMRDASHKTAFLKNCIDFNLYELRREKAAKGQLLGTAVIDLAAYGAIKESLNVTAAVNCKRTYWNAVQPLLYLKIQLVDRRLRSFLTRESLVREDSVDRTDCDSVSVLSAEYAEEAEGASITMDDDISSHSSLGATSAAVTDSNGSSSPQAGRNRADVDNENNVHDKQPEDIQNNVVAGDSDKRIEHISQQALMNSDSQRDDENASASLGGEDPNSERSTDDEITEKPQVYTDDKSISDEEEQHQGDIFTSGNGLHFTPKNDRSKHGKSVRSLGDSCRSNGSIQSNQCSASRVSVSGECNDAVMALKDSRNPHSDRKIEHLEHRIRTLEGELREAATVEISLYSVIAEHGSSMTKVHAPARRLSRFYFHASKQSSESRRRAAKSIVSGLVLVSKACGNDVPRLTFWLSNSIVLRVIMSKSFEDSKSPTAAELHNNRNVENKKTSPTTWGSFANKRHAEEGSPGDWENPVAFVAGLEKVEAWIFSRIIESVWWQTFTPHMQSDNAEGIRSSMETESNKSLHRMSSSIQQQRNLSMELWKLAFNDAYEKICPVRAGGHDCGCLPVLSRVVMEQLIRRLDVAMFNAILRESPDDIPTDPVADPISDAEVLPIPAGEASFGAGAQLKNAIGNWSRWLTDLFGIDDGEDLVDDSSDLGDADDDNEIISHDAPSKCFRLLNALSDLMMLPKDLLLSQRVRKEVCPTLGPPIIARILNSFVPDEFCPDPIPAVVLEALNSEDHFELEDSLIVNFPCAAAPIVYEPPPVALVAEILGEFGSRSQLTRSRSSVLKKSQTSDDELDELDSPPQCILQWPCSEAGQVWKESGSSGLRYQLLRDVWMNCD